MDVFNPVASKVLFPHSGTFSANPITMTAGLTAMRLYDQAAVEHVNALGERARRQIAEAIREADIPACVTGNGSLFRIHMKPQPPRNYRECYNTPRQETTLKMILDYAFNNEINLIGTGSGTISTPMTPVEIDRLTEVLYAAFQKIRGTRSLAAATP
jgi:glutamate-1-semialdehyde 2,1-aminomutase